MWENLFTAGSLTHSSLARIKDDPARVAIKKSAKKAKFEGITKGRTHEGLKAGSYGFKYQDCLEGTLPALALFMHRDSYTFASMGLYSNHRFVDTKNFLKPKDDKPPIADAIEIQGDMSFQTSQVDICFYKVGARTSKDDEAPCLQSLSRFDFKEDSCAGKFLFAFMVVVFSLTIRILTISFHDARALQTYTVGPCFLTLV